MCLNGEREDNNSNTVKMLCYNMYMTHDRWQVTMREWRVIESEWRELEQVGERAEEEHIWGYRPVVPQPRRRDLSHGSWRIGRGVLRPATTTLIWNRRSDTLRLGTTGSGTGTTRYIQEHVRTLENIWEH